MDFIAARGVGGHVSDVRLQGESAEEEHGLVRALLRLVPAHGVRLQLQVVVMPGDFIAEHQRTLHVELDAEVQLQEGFSVRIQALEETDFD